MHHCRIGNQPVSPIAQSLLQNMSCEARLTISMAKKWPKASMLPMSPIQPLVLNAETIYHNVKSTFSSRSRHRLPASMIPIETDEDQAHESGGQLQIGHFVMNQSAVPCFLCMSLSNEARARWPGRLTPPWIFRLVLNHETQFHVQDELRLIPTFVSSPGWLTR